MGSEMCIRDSFYIVYIILTVVILLNLLIAMMSSTYDRILSESELRWRVDFAKLILKLELECAWLQAKPFNLTLNAGERGTDNGDNGRFFYFFRVVKPNHEGCGMEGGHALFED